jgi:choline dehydrogenase-like flavoprotein
VALLNTKLKESSTYDAIVVGSGVSGGWAAKELCEKGLKTLVLERGTLVNHQVDYTTAMMEDYEFEYRGMLSEEDRKKHHYAMRSYFVGDTNKHFFINDLENPYEEVKNFDWIRSGVTGGRSLLWGRQVYRWSDIDFEANAKEGIAIDWPIRYKDIAPWYSYVEKYIGVSGERLGLPQLPDGEFLKPMQLNALEKHFRKEVEKNYKYRNVTIGRVAHITEAQPHHLAMGRATCINRNRCNRGCPLGAYFSSNAATLPAANATGNFAIRPNSLVHSIIIDDTTGKAKGVKIIDTTTNQEIDFFAKVVFLCASTVASTRILLNSTSSRYPNGFGNDSGELGHNLMDHHYHVGALGDYDGFEDEFTFSRPNGLFIPKYVNINTETKQSFLRGWDYQGAGERAGWDRTIDNGGIGESLHEELSKNGGWSLKLMGFGETLPYHENKITLSRDKKDKWGIPTLIFDAELKDNEIQMRKKMADDGAEMLERAGFKNVRSFDAKAKLGTCIHEMGTARMGKDPKTSVLNAFNQVHTSPNVFVTDGACMTSANCVNPSITYMAITARAADHAVSELKKQNL